MSALFEDILHSTFVKYLVKQVTNIDIGAEKLDLHMFQFPERKTHSKAVSNTYDIST